MTARKPKAAAAEPVKRGRGRPAYRPTSEARLQVSQLVAAGMPHDSIAHVLRIARKTLDKNFAQELKNGHADRRAEVIELLWAQARKGNTAATKHLDQITSTALAESTFDRRPDVAEPAPRAPRLGKKEQAALDAQTAGVGSDWGADLGAIPDETAGKTAH